LKISVVIPALDEAADLPGTIESLRAHRPQPFEVIVADGGSTDGTREWLERQEKVGWLRTVDAERGRGRQMNAGAALAAGEALLFLHADATLPEGALERVAGALGDDRVRGGAFTIRFKREDGSPLSMPVIARGINFRTWVTSTATGDQAIFVRREDFEALGGYEPWPLFEDVDLVTRIKRLGRFRILKGPVTISDRRYRTFGPWRTAVLMWWLRALYLRGVPAEELKRRFVDVRLRRQ
jgi:rSAM/selenodomain-associated transferase 2